MRLLLHDSILKSDNIGNLISVLELREMICFRSRHVGAGHHSAQQKTVSDHDNVCNYMNKHINVI